MTKRIAYAPTMRGQRIASPPKGGIARAIAAQSSKNVKAVPRPVKNMVAPHAELETGDRLQQLVRRVSTGQPRQRLASRGGKITRKAEGGKVGTGMMALRALAKKFQEALDSGDEALAKRIQRQMEAMRPGITKELEPVDAEVVRGNQKTADTF